jgi:hypothetical protein
MTAPTTNEVLERDLRLQAVALLALVTHGIRTDIQGLLIGGDERGTVGPGALLAAVRAVRKQVLADLLPVSEEVVGAMRAAYLVTTPDGLADTDMAAAFTAAITAITKTGEGDNAV